MMVRTSVCCGLEYRINGISTYWLFSRHNIAGTTVPHTLRRPSRLCAHVGRVNTLTQLSKKSVAVQADTMVDRSIINI